MVTLHYRIARYTVYTNRIMTGKLGIIFQVIQSAIQIQADTGIGTQNIAFAIKLHRDSVGVHVIAFTAIQRYHKAVAWMHPVALHQP